MNQMRIIPWTDRALVCLWFIKIWKWKPTILDGKTNVNIDWGDLVREQKEVF